MKAPEEIDVIAAIAAAYRPLDGPDLDRLIAEARPLVEQDAIDATEGKSALFWLHDTKVMGWEAPSEPELVAY